jgi:penicillin-insensitive murein DD-endopeptidase
MPMPLQIMVLVLALMLASPAVAQQPARELFGAVELPSAGAAEPIGSYARGCIGAAVQLAADGPGWQAMRLSRNRRWGDPALVDYIAALAAAAAEDGWPGLLVGDMGQPRGGPMRTGHASHQSGLDVDIWLQPMPSYTLSANERETLSAVSVLKKGTRSVDPKLFGEAERLLVYRAARLPGVARVFVAPGIKQSLCAITWRDPSFLTKVRPWYGHDDHIHVRLACPPGARACVDQAAPPPGDGCGEELAYWLSDAPYRPSDTPPAAPLTLADLPQACTAVLRAR